MLRYRGTHHFKSRSGYKGFCDISIYDNGEYTVVIASDRPDSIGTSITNSAEQLAGEVAEKQDINPNKLLWIEHYQPRNGHLPGPEYTAVKFTWNGKRFVSPIWQPILQHQVEQLIGENLPLDEEEELEETESLEAPPKSRVYRGLRDGDEPILLVEEAGRSTRLKKSPLRPQDGDIEWGFNGRGPESTAQAILHYEYGETVARWYCQDLKDEVISKLPKQAPWKGEQWRLTANQLIPVVGTGRHPYRSIRHKVFGYNSLTINNEEWIYIWVNNRDESFAQIEQFFREGSGITSSRVRAKWSFPAPVSPIINPNGGVQSPSSDFRDIKTDLTLEFARGDGAATGIIVSFYVGGYYQLLKRICEIKKVCLGTQKLDTQRYWPSMPGVVMTDEDVAPLLELLARYPKGQ